MHQAASRQRRILLLAYSLDIGGMERMILDLAHGLDPSRFEVFIGCIGRAGEWAGTFRYPNNLRVFGHEGRPNLRVLREVAGWARACGVDLVHSHNSSGLVFGYPVARWLRLPIVHTMHGHDRGADGHRLLDWVEGWMSRHVDLYVPVSLELEAIHARRVLPVLNGVKVPVKLAPSAGGSAAAGVTIGAVGRMVPLKNYALLLEVFARLVRDYPNARLELLGAGPELPRLRESADRLGISLSCRFHGAEGEVGRFLGRCDIFVLPSLSEGTSVALLEAMAKGRICIASDVGGNRGVIQHLHDGLLFVSEDGYDLFDKLVWAMERLGTEEGEQMRRNAWRTVAIRFPLEGMIEAYRRIYEELLRAGSDVRSVDPGGEE